jgi:predicted aspartyl protease
MGTFSVKLRVWNPAQPGGVEELDAFVDTGASFSWISRARLERLGVTSSRKMGFRTIKGRLLERDMATVYVSTDKYSVPDVVVMAEEGEMEVMGAHTIEGLGMAADPVQKRLVPTVMLALVAAGVQRKGRIAQAIDAALRTGELHEPFSSEDFRRACPGLGEGTYNAFLWKHRKGNGKTTELFELLAPNRFGRIHN